MSQEFNFSKDNGEVASAGCAGICPFSQMPASFWRALFRPPFRRRHPVIFWFGIIVAVMVLASALWHVFSDSELDGGDTLAIVPIRGAILNVEPTLKWIRKIENNPRVKGVLVRVDSPGGGAAASQEIYGALARLATSRPVVVSMGSTAASGGLMVSMAAERIFANPSTVTGSIGVRMDIPQVQGLMEKIGVGQETLVTAPYKDAASYMRPLTQADREYLEKVLENMHAQFVEIVAKGRHIPVAQVKGLANGKIYTGQEALSLGLVDELGGQDEAIAWLANKTGIPAKNRLLTPKPEKNGIARLVLSWLGLDFSELAGQNGLGSVARNLTQPVFLYQF